MTRRAACLLAVALPLAGLAGMWASTERWHRQGSEWLVPVEGYDPRDLLRGHFVEFRYVWPGAEEPAANAGATAEPANYPFGGCVTGTAPTIDRVVRIASEAQRKACQHVLAPADTSMIGMPDLPRDGRLYVAQTVGRRLEEQLRNRNLQGMIRVRLRADGTVTPLELTFRARPSEANRDTPAR